MSWICTDCGEQHGRLSVFSSTYHEGVCAWCGDTKAVTSHRDYGYPRQPDLAPHPDLADIHGRREMTPEQYENWTERAALLEFDGGCTRAEAERRAYEAVMNDDET